MRLQHVAVTCSALLALVGSVRAGVIVVDGAGGGAFTQIQPAVDAALEGDTILVKPGSYSAFIVDGKSLTVVGESGPVAAQSGRVTIQDLALGQTVTLARMHVFGPTSDGRSLMVKDCAGAVRCVECDFSTAGAVLVWNAGDVAFAGCTMLGNDGVSSHTCFGDLVGPGAPGLFSTGANAIAIHDCTLRGGHGGNGGDRTGGGGQGILVDGGPVMNGAFIFAARSVIEGGHGGDTDCPSYGCPGDGGGGLNLFAAFGWTLDSTVAGGAPGVAIDDGSGFNNCPADPGDAYPTATPFVFAVSSLGFSIPAVAREGTHLTVTFTGPPGSHVFLNDDLATTFQGVPSWRGVLLSPFPQQNVPGPVRTRRWGVIPASGQLTQVYRVPTLPPGVQAQTRFLQAYRIGQNGLTLGSFRTLTVLDSAF